MKENNKKGMKLKEKSKKPYQKPTLAKFKQFKQIIATGAP